MAFAYKHTTDGQPELLFSSVQGHMMALSGKVVTIQAKNKAEVAAI
jgi:hypothetical protein